MKCDFCGKDLNDAVLIAGKRKRICEFCLGEAVDVILKRKSTNILNVGDKQTVCDICDSDESIFYFNKSQLHICVTCVGTSLESLAISNLDKYLECSPYKRQSGIRKGANFSLSGSNHKDNLSAANSSTQNLKLKT
jgi:hypothetical protein